MKKTRPKIAHTSFRQIKMFEVYCHKCGEGLTTEAEYHEMFETKADAIQAATDFDWEVKGNLATCNECLNK